MIPPRSFSFQDEVYEVRVAIEHGRFVVAAFKGNSRANGYTYSAELQTSIDMKRTTGIEAVEHLMDIAESDVKQGYWEQYTKTSR